MACKIDHAGEVPQAIAVMQESQAGFWRHRCAGCAYLLGRQHSQAAEERLREQVRRLKERVAELEAGK